MSGALKRDEWETVRLGDVCEIGDGLHGTPKYDEHGEYYFINGTNLSNGRIIFDEKTKRVDENTYKKYRIEFGNTLLMSINGTIGNIAYYADEKIVLGKSAAYITTKTPNLNLTYLSHYLQSATAKQYYENNLTGSTIKNLGLKVLRSFELPIPPLDIQRRIAETLDKVTELIILRKTQLEKLDELVKARFVELFGDPEKNTFSWKEEELSEHLTVIGGYAFKSEQFSEEGIPVLRIGNINSGFFKPVNLVYWEDDDALSRYKMYPGDLVMSLTGTVGKDDYGNVCILGNDYDVYYLNQRNAKLELQDTMNKYYLSMLMKFEPIKKKLTGISRGVRQANISNKDILNLSVPIPPIELQNQFATFVEQTDKSKVIIQQSLDTLETLKKSLMQEYFG